MLHNITKLNKIINLGHSKIVNINKSKSFKPLSTTISIKPINNVTWQQGLEGLDSKQLDFYHKEQLIMVDENDKPLGPISKGESHAIETVKKGVYHRALSLLVFDEQDKFLLTQRAASKITFPNYFTNACCSHPQYIDAELEDDGKAIGVKRATIRRANFELGTNIGSIKLEELNFVNRLAYRAESDGGKWGEAEIDYVFILKKNIDLYPNSEELQSYRYVSRSEMKDLLSNDKVKITPWLRLMAKDFLFKYWDNLNNLDRISQPNSIISYKQLFLA